MNRLVRLKNSQFNLLLLIASWMMVPLHCDAQKVTFGVMVCLSGECAEWGANSLKGAQLAVEQLNVAGGLLGSPVELAVQDTRDSTPSRTVTAFRTLSTNKLLHYYVGPTWTAGAMPIAPIIAAQKGIIVTSPSVGLKNFNESSNNIFNTWPHDERATRALARYARSKGWARAAIFGSEDPWVKTQSDVFAEEFERLGGAIAVRCEPNPSSRELKAEALKVKNSNADVVFLSNYQTDVFARELMALKSTVPKLSILMERERVKAAKGALDGSVFAQYQDASDDFKKAFYKRFAFSPGITADTAYDAIMVYAKVIAEVGSDNPEAVRDRMRQLRNYKGASGTFSFDEKGAVDKTPVLWRVVNEEYVREADSK